MCVNSSLLKCVILSIFSQKIQKTKNFFFEHETETYLDSNLDQPTCKFSLSSQSNRNFVDNRFNFYPRLIYFLASQNADIFETFAIPYSTGAVLFGQAPLHQMTFYLYAMSNFVFVFFK